MDLILSIGNTLATIDENATIYRDNQDGGGFTTPCYFIQELPIEIKPGLGSSYDIHTHKFDIAYFPDEESTTKQTDLSAMSAFLLSNFRKIEPNLAHLWNREISIVDSVLHYQFDVRVDTIYDDNSNQMGGLGYSGGVKDGNS